MKILWSLMTVLLLSFDTEAQNTGQGISLSMMPDNGLTAPGRDVTFTCILDLNILSEQALIVWTRHTGTIHTKVAVGTIKQDDFVDNKRYKMSKTSDQGKRQYYTLTISDVQLEDSGTIECSVIHSSRKDTKVLAVCDDLSSDSCSCVHNIGWSSPECYESKSVKELQKAFDRTVTGLGVCFAIAVLYGIIVTVFFARDCIQIIYKKNQLKIDKLKNQQQGYNPYVDSDKLTVEDDLGSIPESGVWSQSDGQNGSNRSVGQRQPVQAVPNKPRENLPVKERPVVTTQSHSNPAFNPDDLSAPAPGYNAVVDMATRPMGGVRPKIPQPQLQPLPENVPPYPEPSHVEIREPYMHPGQPLTTADYYGSSGQGYPSAEASPHVIGQPSEPYHYYDNHENQSAPPSAQSERCLPPERPPPPQRSYTDIPAEKHPSGHHNEYTSPRRLEFGPSNSLHNGASAPYVDDHDTVI